MQLGLLDGDGSFPRKGVEHQHGFGARFRIGGALIEVAEIEHTFDAGIGDGFRQGARSPGHHVQRFRGGVVGETGFAVPLRAGPERRRRVDTGERAPGVLVEEGGGLVGVTGALGREDRSAFRRQPGAQRFGLKQVLVGCAADARFERAGSHAVRPPVEPVAAQGRERIAPLFAQEAVEGGRGGELDARGASFGVPALDERGHARIGRTVVDAHGMGRLGVHEVVGIVGVGLERGHDGRERVFHEAPVAQFGDTAAPEIVEPVPGERLAARRALPPKAIRDRFGGIAPQRIDRHGHELDPDLGQQVGIEPANAVDIALHGGRNAEAVLVAQALDRIEAADHLLRVLHGRVVVLHAGDIDISAVMPGLEALDLRRRCLVEVLLGHPGDFAGPAILGFGWEILSGFDQIERLVDELGVLAETEILIVGEANIGMAVIDDIECLDRLHDCGSSLATKARRSGQASAPARFYAGGADVAVRYRAGGGMSINDLINPALA